MIPVEDIDADNPVAKGFAKALEECERMESDLEDGLVGPLGLTELIVLQVDTMSYAKSYARMMIKRGSVTDAAKSIALAQLWLRDVRSANQSAAMRKSGIGTPPEKG
jgi:hypothetical protein